MEKNLLEVLFAANEGDVQAAIKSLQKVLVSLKGLPPVPHVTNDSKFGPFRTCKSFFKDLLKVESALEKVKTIVLEQQFNAYWLYALRRREDAGSYDKKRAVVKELNSDLRSYGYSISHPETGAPCMALAVGSPDGKGRYVLSDRATKKRSTTRMTLLDYCPIRLVEEPRRRESFLESQDQKSEDDSAGE